MDGPTRDKRKTKCTVTIGCIWVETNYRRLIKFTGWTTVRFLERMGIYYSFRRNANLPNSSVPHERCFTQTSSLIIHRKSATSKMVFGVKCKSLRTPKKTHFDRHYFFRQLKRDSTIVYNTLYHNNMLAFTPRALTITRSC